MSVTRCPAAGWSHSRLSASLLLAALIASLFSACQSDSAHSSSLDIDRAATAIVAPLDRADRSPTENRQLAAAIPPAATETPKPTMPLAPTAPPTSTPRATATASPPKFEGAPDENLARLAQEAGAEFIHVSAENTGLWHYGRAFLHPVALAIGPSQAYMIDGGRVLQFDLDALQPPRLLLEPGVQIESVPVLEPLDLDLNGDALYVLDRAGDVYRYDVAEEQWTLDRYDRPVGDSSSHYYVGVDTYNGERRQLLETNYGFVAQYGRGDESSLWRLPEGRAVDLATVGEDVYVLQEEMFGTNGRILRFRDTRLLATFQPLIPIEEPRQLVATAEALLLLDQSGERLLRLDPVRGRVEGVLQMPEAISAVATAPDGSLYLAGNGSLYLVGRGGLLGATGGGPEASGSQPHDPAFVALLAHLHKPILGTYNPQRDLQMPGAPRHYRLGIHGGVDYYWRAGTNVLATAAGVIIRADTDYVAPDSEAFEAWRTSAIALGRTPDEVLNFYRGRQVWIEHENGLISRYGHLLEVAPGIKVGVTVETGRVVGTVGNTGLPASLESESTDAHLHFELVYGDHYVGQYLRPVEVRDLMDRILESQ